VGGQNRSLSGGWCEPLVGEWPSTSSAISAEASSSPAAAVVPPSFPAAAPASLRRGGGGRIVDHRRDARPVSASYRSTSSSSVHDVLRRSLGRCVYPCRMHARRGQIEHLRSRVQISRIPSVAFCSFQEGDFDHLLAQCSSLCRRLATGPVIEELAPELTWVEPLPELEDVQEVPFAPPPVRRRLRGKQRPPV